MNFRLTLYHAEVGWTIFEIVKKIISNIWCVSLKYISMSPVAFYYKFLKSFHSTETESCHCNGVAMDNLTYFRHDSAKKNTDFHI